MSEKIEPLERLRGLTELLSDVNRSTADMLISALLKEIIVDFEAKKIACCAAKASTVAEEAVDERWIHLTKCRDCPNIRHSILEPSYCVDTETIIVKDSVILPYCKLPKKPTRGKGNKGE